MLNTLRTIIHEVSLADDLTSALQTIVRRVRDVMQTEACSVYFYNSETSRYTLMATEGLNPLAVDKISFTCSEGIVGQVGLREEPINIDDAASHPKYRYLKAIGEDKFRAFLGVPIIHRRSMLGVLVVQRTEKQRFDEDEEAFLVTISAMLAGSIAHAAATGSLKEVQDGHSPSKPFQGTSGAIGVAIGQGIVMVPPADLSAVPDSYCTNIAEELAMLEHALNEVRHSLTTSAEKLACRLPPEELTLFDVYLKMLDDKALTFEIRHRIESGLMAQTALRQVVEEHVSRFEMMEDPYLSERASDVRDLGRRVLSYLQASEISPSKYPDNTILISEELTPAMLAEVPQDKLQGLVSQQGSGSSHVAILARSLGIPTVMGAVDLPFHKIAGKQLIVDGNLGHIYLSPSDELVKHYLEVIEEEKAFAKGLEVTRDLPCVTLDNHKVPLWVNTGLMTDTVRSLDRGAEGVGLYRTEVPFMVRERFPSETEQVRIYRGQLEAFHPRPVTMRTLDIGGDKALRYFPINEDNPFLGWRGIRVTLDHPEIFLVQVRAMLKASAGLDNLRIMLPMISCVFEVEDALQLIHRAHKEVTAEGATIPMPEVGVMIEVPAAVYLVADLASRVDFLSVGSNDLTQYLLAVDRNNPRVASLYHSFHPAVLKALHHIAQEANSMGKPVGICGEMAGDPAAAVLLVAMGFNVLSMSATNLLKVKWILRRITLTRARDMLDMVLQMDNAHVIRSTLELALSKAGIGQILQNKNPLSGKNHPPAI